MKLCKVRSKDKQSLIQKAKRIAFAALIVGGCSESVPAQTSWNNPHYRGGIQVSAPVVAPQVVTLNTQSPRSIGDLGQTAHGQRSPVQSQMRPAPSPIDHGAIGDGAYAAPIHISSAPQLPLPVAGSAVQMASYSQPVDGAEQPESLIDLDIAMPGVPGAPPHAAEAPSVQSMAVPEPSVARIPPQIQQDQAVRIKVPAATPQPASQESNGPAPRAAMSGATYSAYDVGSGPIVGGAAEIKLESLDVTNNVDDDRDAARLHFSDSPTPRQTETPEMPAVEPLRPLVQSPTTTPASPTTSLRLTDKVPAGSATGSHMNSPMRLELPVATAEHTRQVSQATERVDMVAPPSRTPQSHPTATVDPIRPVTGLTPVAAPTLSDLDENARLNAADNPQTLEELPEGLSLGDAISLAQDASVPVTAPAKILEYSVEHPDVCRLIQTGDSALSLVGLKTGKTRIAMVTEVAGGTQKVEIREVSVTAAPKPLSKLAKMAHEMTATVAKAYPQSRIEIIPYDEQLIVRGTAVREKDAKRILSLVRSSTLTPVVDQVQTNAR